MAKRKVAVHPDQGQLFDPHLDVPAPSIRFSAPVEQENIEAVGADIESNPAAVTAAEFGEEENEPNNWYSFISSRVVEAGYSPDTSRLYVRFVKPRPEGTPWVYEGVPYSVWRNFRRSASPGKYVNRVLNSYDYHRMMR